MKGLDDHGRACESAFGFISGYYLWELHQHATAAGAKWDYNDHSTMEIPVTKENATVIYGLCREIREGYSVGVTKSMMKKVRTARLEAHKFLYEEANDPNTSIDRKIELVKLTSKNRE